MTTLTVPLIGDRLYAINATITGVHARRYFPTNFYEAALHPLVMALPGQLRSDTNPGAQRNGMMRTWTLMCIVGDSMAGVPSESAQKVGEALLDTIYDTYRRRPHLELSGQDTYALTCTITGDSGVIPFSQQTELASILFTLSIRYKQSGGIVAVV